MVTVGVLYQAGPRRPLLLALNRAPTAGPVAPLAQEQRTHSGLHSPIRVMSETRPYTTSGAAAISTVTSSCAMRFDMVKAPGDLDGCLSLTGHLTWSIWHVQTYLSMTERDGLPRVAVRRA